MSSSSASQCSPRLLILTCVRSSALLPSSLGNHASGTPSVRPSLNSTHILSSSKRTRVALTEVLIPRPHDQLPILFHDLNQFAKCSSVIAIIVGHRNIRKQPELGLSFVFLNMNMSRFAWRSFIRIEEEFEAAIAKDNRHSETLPNPHFAPSPNHPPMR